MKDRSWMALAVVTTLGAGCSARATAERTVVASFYPLAFAADRIAGPGWEVVDLTPPGTEAHDVELSLKDRAAIEDADLVLYLGDLDFQPQVEAAVEKAWQEVVPAADRGELEEGHAHEEEGDEHEEASGLDPHVWLDPTRFAEMIDRVAEGFAVTDPGGADDYRHRGRLLMEEAKAIDDAYSNALHECRFSTMVVSHEAFGYLAARYGLEQVGLAGLEPEGEPTAGALGEAQRLLSEAQAGAVFYEAGDEAERIAETVAADAGVPALPLSTLESRPPTGDYLSVMEDNLASLRQGLGCG